GVPQNVRAAVSSVGKRAGVRRGVGGPPPPYCDFPLPVIGQTTSTLSLRMPYIWSNSFTTGSQCGTITSRKSPILYSFEGGDVNRMLPNSSEPALYSMPGSPMTPAVGVLGVSAFAPASVVKRASKQVVSTADSTA